MIIRTKKIKSVNESGLKGRATLSAIKAFLYKVRSAIRTGNKDRFAALRAVFGDERRLLIGTIKSTMLVWAKDVETHEKIIPDLKKYLR